jgi:hypothetical protein
MLLTCKCNVNTIIQNYKICRPVTGCYFLLGIVDWIFI